MNDWHKASWVAMGYYPNEQQAPAAMSSNRFVAICGGERGGKSFTTAAIALSRLNKPKAIYWIVGPDYELPRKEFEYIHDALLKLGMLDGDASMPKDGSWRMKTKFDGLIQTRTASDLQKLAAEPVDGFIMSEANQQTLEAWHRMRGRAAEKRGWGILSGTLEQGAPWYSDLLNRWQAPNKEGGRSFFLPTWTNTAIFPGGREDAEIKALEASMTHERFMERYGAVPSKPAGLVFPQFDYTLHVQDIERIEDVGVELAIDPGKNAYAVLFVQQLGDTVHVLDEVYTRGRIAQEVIPIVQAHPLWKHVTGGVIDRGGRQQHATHSQVEIWEEHTGLLLRSNDAVIPQEVSREAVAFRLQSDPLTQMPRMLFSSAMRNDKSIDGTADSTLAEFELFRWREYRHGSGESHQPIDANNHGVKALGYWLYDVYGSATHERKRSGKTKSISRWSD